MPKFESIFPGESGAKTEKIDKNGQYELDFKEETEAEKTAREAEEKRIQDEKEAAEAEELRQNLADDHDELTRTFRNPDLVKGKK